MKARIELNEHYTFTLALQCPSCGDWEHSTVQTAFTGKEFTCDCGEDIRVSAAALSHVQEELVGVRTLYPKEFDVPA